MSKYDDKELTKFLEAFPVESREIALWLRDFVWDLYPKCNELIYDNYNFLAFGWLSYQRNDYLGRIASAKRPETQAARLAQMLDELRRGDVYMKMSYKPKPPAY